MEDRPCTYRVSTKAVIKNGDGKILLMRERDGQWELPGGGLDHGEDPRDALRREISEEIGCKADWISDQPIAFWSIRKEVGSPELKWFAFVAYEVKITGELKLNKDETEGMEVVEDAGYFSPEEAKTLKLHDNVKPFFAY